MTGTILKTKPLVENLKAGFLADVKRLKELGVIPRLDVILVGSDSASQVYVRSKQKFCESLQMLGQTHFLSEKTTQNELLALVEALNQDPAVHGILVQSPLPVGLDLSEVQESILPEKDVDGFHPLNAASLYLNRRVKNVPGFVPCTPLGVLEVLKWAKIPIAGRHAVVLGRSAIVGKPMASLLLRENATVTICHSQTENLKFHCLSADILISAIGISQFVKRDWVKEGATVIDVGINSIGLDPVTKKRKISGDVDFEGAKEIAGAITPVPGGVGPMTIAMLISNTIRAAWGLHEKNTTL